jgi:hypothetical protein
MAIDDLEQLRAELGDDFVGDDTMIDVGALSEVLKRVVELRKKKEEIEIQLKSVSQEIDSLESLAAEQLMASGLDNCRVAGKTWWTESQLLLSVPKEKREEVMAVAERLGIAEELTTINTATLKSWLLEQAKERGKAADEAIDGTGFEGLVEKFVRVRLRSRTVS